MKSIYLDIFSGISGDMFIGALLDLGIDFHEFEHAMEKLKLEGYHLHAIRKQKANIEGVKFDVHLAHDHAHSEDHDHEKHSDSHDPGEHADHGHEHAHHHEHEKGHPHDHGAHEHEHEHGRSFAQIKNLIEVS